MLREATESQRFMLGIAHDMRNQTTVLGAGMRNLPEGDQRERVELAVYAIDKLASRIVARVLKEQENGIVRKD